MKLMKYPGIDRVVYLLLLLDMVQWCSLSMSIDHMQLNVDDVSTV